MHFFGQLTLAYKKTEPVFKKLYSWANEHEDILPLCYYNHIKNLQLLFEFLLPTVSFLLLLLLHYI